MNRRPLLWLIALGLSLLISDALRSPSRGISAKGTPLFADGNADELDVPRSSRDRHQGELERLGRLGRGAVVAGVTVGGVLVGKSSEASAADAIGYKAAISPYAPSRNLRVIPLLPQSALLNSLPLQNPLIGELQAYLESFLLLVNPAKEQVAQVKKRDSLLWDNLRVNAQRAAGMFIYNREQLLPLEDPTEPPSVKLLREKYGNEYLDKLQKDVLKLVDASRKASVSESLRSMRYALNSLCNVAYLRVEKKDCLKTLEAAANEVRTSSFGTTELESAILEKGVMPGDGIRLPTLEGRTTVILEFCRPGSNSTDAKNGLISNRGRRVANGITLDNLGREVPSGDDGKNVYVKLIVDGINHPLAAGAFLDLCKRGYYDGTGISQDKFMFSASRGELSNFDGEMGVERKLLGCREPADPDGGYIDKAKKVKRRFPIEVLRQKTPLGSGRGAGAGIAGREGANGNERYTNVGVRYTAVGEARNSAVFTQDTSPVLSFATYGAIGMWHPQNELSGASAAFFSIPFDSSQSVTRRTAELSMSRLNQKYSLFAYCVDGNDVLSNLQAGDVLVRTSVEPGLYNLSV